MLSAAGSSTQERRHSSNRWRATSQFCAYVEHYHLTLLCGAKEVLDAVDATYQVVELDKDIDGKAIRAKLDELLGRTSVPAIWINGKFVGGCNDGSMGGLVTLDKSGQLRTLLREAGAIQ